MSWAEIPSTPQVHALTDYVDALKDPRQLWPIRSPQSSRQSRTPTTIQSHKAHNSPKKKEQLDQLVQAYAPRIWWHAADPFGPTDSLKFIQNSELWEKPILGRAKMLKARGEINAVELNRTGGSRQYLVNAAIKKIERLNLSEPVKPAADLSDVAPIFWKLSTHPVVGELQNRSDGHQRIILEYWYHTDYSHANLPLGIGNHQGDWEGMAVVVDLSLDEQNQLAHYPVALYYAAHEGGQWFCPSEVTWIDESPPEERTGRSLASVARPKRLHPEAFSAVGTHATYPKEGQFWSGVKTEQTRRDRAWNSWKWVTPLNNEPYLGFEGQWGDTSYLPTMSGPRLPGVSGKSLPKGSPRFEAKSLRKLKARCDL